MKALLSITIFILTICFSFAQTAFEGSIKWSMSMTSTAGTSPSGTQLTEKEKADMKKNIAEMEKQMNDPQMQAMFESNPQMKATLEKQLEVMKAMQSEGGVNNLLPKSYTIKVKDGSSLTSVEGGITASMGDILYQKSTDKTYYIKRDSKTYSVAPKAPAKTTDSSVVTVTATTETKKILTYNCTKYVVTITQKGQKQVMNLWATKDLKQYDVKSFQVSDPGTQAYAAAFKKINGVVLGMEMTHEGQTMKMEVIELKATTLPASDFVIPAGFKEVPYGH